MRLRRGIYNKNQWFIEQKVDRSEEIPLDGDPDLRQRVQDGYALVMAFWQQPVIACEQCGNDIRLPVLEHGESKCTYCHERPGQYATNIVLGGYWPLCDLLIEHIEMSSYKMSDEWFEQMKARNKRLRADIIRRAKQVGYDVALDFRNQIGNVPRVGYGSGPASFGRV